MYSFANDYSEEYQVQFVLNALKTMEKRPLPKGKRLLLIRFFFPARGCRENRSPAHDHPASLAAMLFRNSRVFTP